MTGKALRQQIRILLLATAIGAMMSPAALRAEGNDAAVDEAAPVYTGLPEVEIDGSVLEHLGKNFPAVTGGEPLKLIPPPEMAVQSLTAPTLTNPESFAGPKTPAPAGSPTLTGIAEESLPVKAKAITKTGTIQPVIREVPAPAALLTEIVKEPLPEIKAAIRPVIREIPAPVAKAVEKKTAKLVARAVPPLPGYKPQIPAKDVALVVDVPQKMAQPVAGTTSKIRNESDLKMSSQTIHTLIEKIASAPLSDAAAAEQVAKIEPSAPADIPAPVAPHVEPAPVLAVVDEREFIQPPKPGDHLTGSKAFKNLEPPEQGLFTWFPIKMRVKDSAELDPSANKPAVRAVKAPAEIVPPAEITAAVPVEPSIVNETAVAAAPEKIAVVVPERGPIKVWNHSAQNVEPVVLGPIPDFVLPKPEVIAQTPPPPAPEKIAAVETQQQDQPESMAIDDTAPPEPEVIAAAPASIDIETPVEIHAEGWRQENPEVVIKDAPIPGRRPEKQMASQEFVEQARRTVMDTYTVMRNDGAPMPAVAKADVSKEKLAPTRMSVADLANDPLASQILAMSPAEVAATLNEITPAAGRQLSRDLNAISKPRIVRQEGERIFKSRQKNFQPVYDAAPAERQAAAAPLSPVAETPASAPVAPVSNVPESSILIGGERLDLALPFPVGIIDLPDDAKANMDNGVIPVLKSREGMRVQIVAFASPTGGKEASARRTALSRALAVRSYLISQGIDATRMDVRALGMQTDPQAPKDKVDLHLVTPKKG